MGYSGPAAVSTAPTQVLLIEDDARLAERTAEYLQGHEMQVEVAGDGERGLQRAEAGGFDVVLLDLMLPRLDGLEVCRRLRQRSRVPVIMLSARSEEIDRVLGLELGADDYLPKPFSLRELVARLRVLLRRAELLAEGRDSPQERLVRRGRLTLDLDRYEAWYGAVRLPLTLSEFLLLAALARRPGHVRTRDQLLDEVHGDDEAGSIRTIDSHIKRLRRKLALADSGYDPVEAVYGLGYRFRDPP